MIITYKFRLKDKHAAELNRQARAVNVVWNYCNEAQQYMVRRGRPSLDWHDLQRSTYYTSELLNIAGHTVQLVCRQFDVSRKTHKKRWLDFRGRKSLGWIPFHQGSLHVLSEGKLSFRCVKYETMNWRSLPVGKIMRGGSFNQDTRGRWYVNVPVEIDDGVATASPDAIGVDLGLDRLFALSDGTLTSPGHHYRKLQTKLAAAQRANKYDRVRSLNAKIKNQRADYLHKLSTNLTSRYGLIFVGNVSTRRVARTKLAKSAYDAGWGALRKMLRYKSIRNGGRCIEVNENLTTQTCSQCGSLPPERPKGIAGLGIREFSCDCGVIMNRDVNAAKNILRRGLATLAEGAPH